MLNNEIKNEKIAKYVGERDFGRANEFQTYLNFFIENHDKFEEVLLDKEKFSFGNGLKKYERLSAYIAEEHNICWKDGENIPSSLVSNLHKLARREKEANMPKKVKLPEHDTVFRIYHPDDDWE
ncbi:hypothetical protein [Herbaspirillum sp. ST 5-3]|uniref:hypothetical protein n=1 Tax=Oxalobacteraceae TaxID=75682 RepID=UPI0010A3D50C|nr:hypothetical protein [Herbaspirillum sp. ST 5-3]